MFCGVPESFCLGEEAMEPDSVLLSAVVERAFRGRVDVEGMVVPYHHLGTRLWTRQSWGVRGWSNGRVSRSCCECC